MFKRDILSWWWRPAFLRPYLKPFRKSRETLFAGPWVGEFGWELLCWQGFVRKLSRQYRRTVICCPQGREALYADFAAQIIPHHIRGTSECNEVRDVKNPEEMARVLALIPREADYLRPLGYQPLDRQEIIRFGQRRPELGVDVLFHPRGRGFGTDRNWSEAKWLSLLERMRAAGLRVGCIGVKAATLPIPGDFEDWRDKPLAETLDIIASARVVVGPSSGPMHLASLCGTPHVVWADKARYARGHTSRAKYETLWNPLHTQVTMLDDEGFDPSVAKVWNALQGVLDEVLKGENPAGEVAGG